MANTYMMVRNDLGVIVKVLLLDNLDGTFSEAKGAYGANLTPVDAATVSNVMVDMPGTTFDTLHANSISYTIKNVGANSITWQVLAANLADFSDAQIVKGPSAVAAAALDNYTVGPAVYRYYKVQISDTVNLSHGTAHVGAMMKG